MLYINKHNFYNYSGYFCAAVYLLVMYLSLLEPNPDEAIQIEAAYQLFMNGKYQSSWKISNDLSSTQYTYLTAWPIGYSFLIYILMLFKINITNSILLIRLSIIFLNIFFAQKISNLILRTTLAHFVFNLIFAFIIIVESVSAPELIIMLCILTVTYFFILKKDKKLYYLDFFFIGFIMSFSLIFKYTSVLYIFSIFIYIYLDSVNLIFFKKVKNIFFYFLPIIITAFFIFYKNYLESKNISTLTNFNSLDKFKFIFEINYLYVFYIVFIDSLQFSRLINQGFFYFFTKNIDFKIFLLIFIIFFNYFYFKRLRYLIINYYKIILSFLGIIFLSFIISILFFTKKNEWYPLIEQRYYTPCSFFLLLIYIKPIDYIYNFLSKEKIKYLYFTFSILFALTLSLFLFRRFNNSSLIKNNISLLMNEIKMNDNQSTKILIFADDNYFTFLPRDNFYQIFHFSEENLSFTKVSKNLNVFIVSSSIPLRKFNNNNYQAQYEKIVAYAKNNNFKKIAITPTTYIFSKKFEIKK